MWHWSNKIERNAQGAIRADIEVPATSPWFEGHFPGEPVLPGLAQISLVFDLIQKASEGDLRVASVNRVRFKRIVRPDDCLEVIAAPLKKEKDGFTFRMQIQGDLVCSGVMRLKRENNSE